MIADAQYGNANCKNSLEKEIGARGCLNILVYAQVIPHLMCSETSFAMHRLQSELSLPLTAVGSHPRRRRRSCEQGVCMICGRVCKQVLNANCHISMTTAPASEHLEGSLGWSRILVAERNARPIADTSHVVVRYRGVIGKGEA